MVPTAAIVFQWDQEFDISKNQKISELHCLGKAYRISFDLFLSAAGSSWNRDLLWNSIVLSPLGEMLQTIEKVLQGFGLIRETKSM